MNTPTWQQYFLQFLCGSFFVWAVIRTIVAEFPFTDQDQRRVYLRQSCIVAWFFSVLIAIFYVGLALQQRVQDIGLLLLPIVGIGPLTRRAVHKKLKELSAKEKS